MLFNTELTPEFILKLIKTAEGRKQLAQKSVEFLDSDGTQPINHRDEWVGEVDLRGFESLVVQKGQLYREFADFCLEAENLSRIDEIRALFQLGRINGLRRMVETERPDQLIRDLLEQSWPKIRNLNDSARKTRLQSLWLYHSGEYAYVVGDYDLAATSHERGADLAKMSGDIKSMVIARFCATVDCVNLALLNDFGNIDVILAKMRAAGVHLDSVLKAEKDETSIRWSGLNVPIHRIVLHFLAKKEYTGLDDDFNRLTNLRRLDPELYEAHKSTIAVVHGIVMLNKGYLAPARSFAKDVVEGHRYTTQPSPEYLATAHLVLAQVAIKSAADPRSHLEDAVAVKGSAHQVRAIAQRALLRKTIYSP